MARQIRQMLWCVVLVVVAGFVPTAVGAADLCFQGADGHDFVLKNFQVKKGQTFPVGGWSVEFFPFTPPLFKFFPVSGQAIATSDGKHVAMQLTQAYTYFTRAGDHIGGQFQGADALNSTTFYSVSMAAGTNGRIGPGASGKMFSLQVNGVANEIIGSVQNLTPHPGDSSLLFIDCQPLGDFALL